MANEPDSTPAPGVDGLAPAASVTHRRERTAIRNVTLLLVVRGAVLAGGVASAALVPRTMGPATYGRYDLVTMLTFWFTMLGGLGIGQVMSRQTPQLEAEGTPDKLRALFGNFLVLRNLSGFLVAGLYLAATSLWLREIDGTVLLLLAVATLLRGSSSMCYSLFLGQGRIGRWALPEVVRQWGSVAFALPGFLVGGLRGAVCGYLISESIIFVVGAVGARGTLERRALRFDLGAVAPLVRLGLAFYASDLVVSAIERSGAVLIRLVTHDYAQVGMFGVSYQIFMAAVLSTNQISTSFVPLLTVLRTRGEDAELRLWVQRVVKWLTVTASLGFLGSLMLGREIVPLVLGRAYGPVYPNLVALAATLLLVPLSHVCSVLALTHDRPAVLFRAALLKLAVFWGLGVPLVMRWGSLGACIAMGAAIGGQATYLMVHHSGTVGPAFRRWLLVVGAGLLFTPLALLRGPAWVNVALYFVAAGGFLLVLRMLGAISARELRAVYHALGMARGQRGKGAEVQA